MSTLYVLYLCFHHCFMKPSTQHDDEDVVTVRFFKTLGCDHKERAKHGAIIKFFKRFQEMAERSENSHLPTEIEKFDEAVVLSATDKNRSKIPVLVSKPGCSGVSSGKVTAGECPDKSSTSSEPKNSKVPISLARLAKELVHTLKNENRASADLSDEEEIRTSVEDAGNSVMKTEKKRKPAKKTKVLSPSPFSYPFHSGIPFIMKKPGSGHPDMAGNSKKK
ncbi:hypothetical protein CDAR_548992 [Caerostris darwini]|uniref:Uncharacterized protein n=1 Tax=Caerostris darwini TaxID=1538125 RepID=A0AAV4WJR1_9ARAC|nr:hypothetical protein CDAR_548992 [Caerostris darwini]